MNHPADEHLLQHLILALAPVPGVAAIVLGGSRARGTAHPKSDYDIGLYYESALPIDVETLGDVAKRLDDSGSAARVTPIGEWGPWINGGAWLTVGGQKVDLLYRELDRVRAVIEACSVGAVTVHYQAGHPHAFVSAIYMGEIAYARPLFDPALVLAGLKQRTEPYPVALGLALQRKFLWEAGFSLENAMKGLPQRDVAYVAACCARCVACLAQALFALNGRYLLNEKGAVAGVEQLALHPSDFAHRVVAAFQNIGVAACEPAIERLEQLVHETTTLAR